MNNTSRPVRLLIVILAIAGVAGIVATHSVAWGLARRHSAAANTPPVGSFYVEKLTFNDPADPNVIEGGRALDDSLKEDAPLPENPDTTDLLGMIVEQQKTLSALADTAVSQKVRIDALEKDITTVVNVLGEHMGHIIGEYDTANPEAWHLSRRDYLERRERQTK